uniref:Secreted protein n=1 Tax=Ascaris lumbricoides TaxID=6252 RepID=A0A0M3HLZ7_ASCLU
MQLVAEVVGSAVHILVMSSVILDHARSVHQWSQELVTVVQRRRLFDVGRCPNFRCGFCVAVKQQKSKPL